MKKLTLCLIALLTAACLSLDLAKASIKALYHGNDPACTAFSINQDAGYWLTANHCLSTEMFVQDLQTQPAAAIEIKSSSEWDLLIIQTPTLHSPAVEFSEREPKVGAVVTVIGVVYPQTEGDELRLLPFWGRIAAKNVPAYTPYWASSMLIDINGGPGMSGSPIVNQDGKVVSLLQGGRTTMPSYAYTAPYENIIAFVAGLAEKR